MPLGPNAGTAKIVHDGKFLCLGRTLHKNTASLMWERLKCRLSRIYRKYAGYVCRSIVNMRFNWTPRATFAGMAMLFASPSRCAHPGDPDVGPWLGGAKSMAMPTKVDCGVQLNRLFTIDRDTWAAGALKKLTFSV